ncbi:MAG: methyl-accepting chemotaxis protein [Pseudomonadales bacterium]
MKNNVMIPIVGFMLLVSMTITGVGFRSALSSVDADKNVLLALSDYVEVNYKIRLSLSALTVYVHSGGKKKSAPVRESIQAIKDVKDKYAKMNVDFPDSIAQVVMSTNQSWGDMVSDLNQLNNEANSYVKRKEYAKATAETTMKLIGLQKGLGSMISVSSNETARLNQKTSLVIGDLASLNAQLSSDPPSAMIFFRKTVDITLIEVNTAVSNAIKSGVITKRISEVKSQLNKIAKEFLDLRDQIKRIDESISKKGEEGFNTDNLERELLSIGGSLKTAMTQANVSGGTLLNEETLTFFVLITVSLTVVFLYTVIMRSRIRVTAVSEENVFIKQEASSAAYEIGKLMDSIAQLGRGDLGVIFDTKYSSTAEIAKGLNGAILSLRSYVVEVQGLITNLASTAQQSEQGAKNARTVRKKQEEAVEQTVELVKEMMSEISSIDNISATTLKSALEAERVMENGISAVKSTGNKVDQTNRIMTAVMGRIKQVIELSQELVSHTQEINQISHRTKSIAANCLIWANGLTGDEGKRASATADEMSKASDEVKDQIESVGSLLQRLTSVLKESQHEVEDAKTQSNDLVKSSEEAERCLDSLHELYVTVRNNADGTKKNVTKLVEMSRDITNRMNLVSEYTDQGATTAHQTAEAVSHLSKQASKVDSTMNNYST